MPGPSASGACMKLTTSGHCHPTVVSCYLTTDGPPGRRQLPSPEHPFFLRYHFASRARAASHLHVVDSELLLFCRHANASFMVGTKAVVELLFEDTAQTRLLAGEIASTSSTGGVWIRTDALDLTEPCFHLLPARLDRRLGANLPVEVRSESSGRVALLLDFSPSGAQLRETGWAQGTRVSLRLVAPPAQLPEQLGHATIVWNRSGLTGVSFDRSEQATCAAVDTLYAYLRQAWARAPLLLHPLLCCNGGICLDPPSPKLAPALGRGVAIARVSRAKR